MVQPPPAKKQKVEAISGDALDEDFLLEDGFAPSDAESGHDTLRADQIDDLGQEGSDENQRSKGHKLEKEKGKKKKNEAEVRKKTKDADQAPVEKSKVKKMKDSPASSENLHLLPNEELALKFAEKQKRGLPNLSGIEMEEIRISDTMIFSSSSVLERISLLSFIREAMPTLTSTLAKPPKREGSPRIIVIAGSALRVADLCREVRPYKTKEIDVAKLFSKHFKLSEHIEYLTKTKVGIAVGTPNRIGKLLSESDSLHLTHLSHLILDVTHLDAKKRSLLDMPEASEDLFKLVLGNSAMMSRLREGRMKIAVY